VKGIKQVAGNPTAPNPAANTVDPSPTAGNGVGCRVYPLVDRSKGSLFAAK
jgi:hypothetical protein